MTARVLPRAEWDRLPQDVADMLATIPDGDAAPVVIERGGEIVARMVVMRVTHLESFWMAPEAKGNAGVTRELLRACAAQAALWNPNWLYANSAPGDGVSEALERLGGEWMPMHTYLLPVQRLEMEAACLQP